MTSLIKPTSAGEEFFNGLKIQIVKQLCRCGIRREDAIGVAESSGAYIAKNYGGFSIYFKLRYQSQDAIAIYQEHLKGASVEDLSHKYQLAPPLIRSVVRETKTNKRLDITRRLTEKKKSSSPSGDDLLGAIRGHVAERLASIGYDAIAAQGAGSKTIEHLKLFLSGSAIYVPTMAKQHLEMRNEAMYSEFEKGATQIELAQKYEVCVRQVYDILKKVRKQRRGAGRTMGFTAKDDR